MSPMRWPAALRGGRHGRRRLAGSGRTTLIRPGLAVIVLLAAVSSVVVVAGSGRAVSAAPQSFSGTCPGGTSACIQVTLPCQTSPCPSVVAGPTQALVTDQYVYLALSSYPVGDTIRIAFCTTDGTGTIAADPYCATTTPSGIKLSKQFVVVGSDGTANAATPVAFDPPGQDNPPLAAVPLVQNGQPAGSFFCDNGPEFCGVVVTDDGPGAGAGPSDTSDNTVVVPLDFSPGASACPTTDPLLFTDSAFTVEHLLPAVVQATCNQKNGVVALNTATNTASEISDLAAGNTPVAFTDDPWDTQLNSGLTSGTTKFAYIPVALSATVVAFLGGAPDETQSGIVFPMAQYNMTPNMVAGVLTTTYAGGGAADNLVTAPAKNQKPPLDCSQLVGCNKKTVANFNTFYMLNVEPSGVGQPGAIGSFFSNTSAGTNYQLSDWLCSAPNAPFELSVQKVGSSGQQQVSVTDSYNTAAGTFTTPPTQSPFWNTSTPASKWPFKTCQATSQFPTLSPGSLQQYQPADTPALQSKSIRAYGTGGDLAFGAMDWSQASFNGLNATTLQNASGSFVAPSQASIDAAMTDAVEQPDGTLTFNYGDAGNTAAYPMPMVTYAVVPTSPVPAADAQSLKSFLSNVVAFSAGNDGALPGGYVPLTAGLAAQATADIAKDIVAAPAGNTGPGGSTSAGSGSTSSPQKGTASGPESAVATVPGATAAIGKGPTSETTAAPGGTSSPVGSGAKSPTSSVPAASGVTGAVGKFVTGAILDVVVAGSRIALPLLIGLTIGALIVGPALLVWRPRRRPVTVGSPSGESEGPG